MRSFLQLFPIIFLLIAEPFSFASDIVARISLIFSLTYMALYIILSGRIDYRMLMSLLLFMPFFLLHFFISFSYQAAIESSLRYFLPIIILLYGYSVRHSFKAILSFLSFYMVISFCYQFFIYFNFLNGITKQWFYHEVTSGIFNANTQFGIIRATGLMGFFDVYGFLNFIMFFLIHYFYEGKYKYFLQIIALTALFLTLSFKLIFVFIIVCLFIKKFRLRVILSLSTLSLVVGFLFSTISQDIMNQIETKVSFYITKGNSARAESYRVMIDELKSFNIIGEGIGSFGGAAASEYKSPFYQKINFNWYETKQLLTTDTYFPHMFVELGIVTSFLYLLIILFPFFKMKHNKVSLKIIIIIYGALFFDSIFSFALNNMLYLLFSLLLIYPIIEHTKNKQELVYES